MAESDIERLRDSIDHAWEEARKFGLDPFPTHFELVPASIMYEFASYSLPGRFSHWTHGKAYHRQKMQYDFGLSKIYEMVVNTNPSYAFLMDMNDLLQNTFVAAHVFGHTDFFKNNAYFQHTSRRMIDKVSIHAERIAKYEFDHGKGEVERFLDAVLSIQEHVDYNLLIQEEKPRDPDEQVPKSPGIYDDLWGMDQRTQRAEEARARRASKTPKFPEKPQKDILLFLSQHAPHLEPWQRDIIEIVRTEMLYFVPQMQTKVMNEGWACLKGDTLVFTEQGLVRYDTLHRLLEHNQVMKVNSGDQKLDLITDRHITRQAATIRLRTRRGLILEGAEEHKLNIGPDQWIALKDVNVGQRIPLSVGDNIWPEQLVAIETPIQKANWATVEDVARVADVGVHTVYRSLNGKTTYAAERITTAIESTGYTSGTPGKALYSKRFPLVSPTHITETFGEFLGDLIGNGNIHTSKNAIGFTTGDRDAADRYARLVLDLFAIETTPFWDAKTISGKGGRWRVVFYSANVLDLLQSLGIDLKAKARQKAIPDVILHSPKAVVSAFLRAYFDCDGCASIKAGLILSTFSDTIALALQILLLNYGILSRRNGVNVHIKGSSAQKFAREIGFNLVRKQEKLELYLANRKWFKVEDPTDEIVSIEHDFADVYDITVDRSHRYVANGMLHHNSIWHSRIMRRLGETGVISDAQTIEFAQLHSGVLSPSRTSLNPYYLGFKMFEDVERRWNNPTPEERERLGRKPDMGLQKIFEIREMNNDVSFLRNYLTEELVKELDLYLYKKEGDEWVIAEKNWEKVRDGIVASLNNFGSPYLVIDNGDYRGNRELYIVHVFEGQELDMSYAEKTLQHVHLLWGRPVHLETIYDGKKILISYDGERSSKSTLEK
jgi:stage V sporulation protein R